MTGFHHTVQAGLLLGNLGSRMQELIRNIEREEMTTQIANGPLGFMQESRKCNPPIDLVIPNT